MKHLLNFSGDQQLYKPLSVLPSVHREDLTNNRRAETIGDLCSCMTHGLSKTHLWGQLPENYITLNPYNFYSLSRIGKVITAINSACENHIQK